MLMLISPSKKLNFEDPARYSGLDNPQFLDYSQKLVNKLRQYSPQQLAKLMGISDPLAHLNVGRFSHWQPPFNEANAKTAIYAFSGDVYTGLDADSLDKRSVNYLQKNLQILSGLYGLLKPMDLIQPYRLEMGKKVRVDGTDNLYQFWKTTLTHAINEQLEKAKQPAIINLASQEYFKVLDDKKIQGRIITPIFKDLNKGKYQVLSFFAKKARGMMVRFAALNKINSPNKLKTFDCEGYHYNEALSNGNNWVFTRDKRS